MTLRTFGELSGLYASQLPHRFFTQRCRERRENRRKMILKSNNFGTGCIKDSMEQKLKTSAYSVSLRLCVRSCNGF